MMMKINVKKLLTDLGIEFKNSNSKNIITQCWNPAHNDSTPSLSIDSETGIFYCFGCHMKGNAVTIVQNFLNLSTSDALIYLQNYSLFTASEYSLQLKQKIHERLRNRSVQTEKPKKSRVVTLPPNIPAFGNAYLYRRGITDEDIRVYDIRVCNAAGLYNGWILIPIYYKSSIVNYFLRDVVGSGKIYHTGNKFLFGFDTCNVHEPLIIVEGIFDCIKTRRVFKNCVAILGNRFTSLHIELFKKFSDVIILSDNDDGGKMVWLDAMQLIPYTNVYIAQLPDTVKDPDSTTPEVLYKSIHNATMIQDVVATPKFYNWKLNLLIKSKRISKKR